MRISIISKIAAVVGRGILLILSPIGCGSNRKGGLNHVLHVDQ